MILLKKYLKIHPFFIWPSGSSFKTEIVLFIRTVITVTLQNISKHCKNLCSKSRLPHEAVFRRFLRGFILNYPLIMWQMKRAFQICKLSRSSFKNDDFRCENVIDQSDQVEAASEAVFRRFLRGFSLNYHLIMWQF